jgi:PadR family transcriptional regulator PadR
LQHHLLRKQNALLIAAGFEPAEGDLWRKEGDARTAPRESVGVGLSKVENERRGSMSNEEREREIKIRPRNWLVPVILVTLREWNSYGYELMERVRGFGLEAMNPGTLYRTLRQMEKEGVVKSAWETSKGGPPRRMYSITDAGEVYLSVWAEALKQYQQTMNAFFRVYRGWVGAMDGREQRRRVAETAYGGRDHVRSGENGALPLENYDELTVQEISKKLVGLTKQEIQSIWAYEKQHKNRKTLLKQLEGVLKGPGMAVG